MHAPISLVAFPQYQQTTHNIGIAQLNQMANALTGIELESVEVLSCEKIGLYSGALCPVAV